MRPEETAVFVHPDFDPIYYGFYVDGLRRVFGARSVRVGLRAFPGPNGRSSGNKMSMKILARRPDGVRRISVEADDMATFDPVTEGWADLVGKVNLADGEVPPRLAGRVLPLGPSFGVRAWSGFGLAALVASIAISRLPRARRRALVLGYLRQYARRLPEPAYRPRPSDPAYLFFSASAWVKHAEVNPPRQRFLEACRGLPGLSVEGGFVPTVGAPPPDLHGHMAPRRYPVGDYLRKLSRSVVAFNAPAVHGCLGWKLGEYLALGKAIVSLPLTRRMPAPLTHGEHVHFVGDSHAEVAAAVDLLRRDHDYRRRLERNARAYYERYLAPDAVIRRLMSAAGVEPRAGASVAPRGP